MKISAEALQSFNLTIAQLRELQARLNKDMAEALATAGAPIQSSVVCMDCGSVNDRKATACPECNRG